jgi:hypothetical protein
MVGTLEEKTQQPDAGCVAVVGGGGDLVAALEALGKTQAISMHPLEEVALVQLWSCWSWLDCGLLRVRATTVSMRAR